MVILVRILIAGIAIWFISSILLVLMPFKLANDNCNCEDTYPFQETRVTNGLQDEFKHIFNEKLLKNESSLNKHSLAVLVPFRDRFDELQQFIPHISKFLTKQKKRFHIFILNQIDYYRFNRASLINIGFLYTKDFFDYIAMHDVDLLPLNDQLKYDYPERGPLHIAAPELHPKYHYKTFVGGILLVRREHFQKMNGMSNKYWGWGLEDDEFYVRIKDAGFPVNRPMNLTTNHQNTFLHVHDRKHRRRDTEKCFNQKEETRKRDRKTGLHDVQYKIENIKRMTIDNFPFTVLNIRLSCDQNLTPWCDCSLSQIK